jgi:hypothetical protein
MDDLIGFVWSAPMRDLAVRLQMSEVGFRKLLSERSVPVPPQGYWAKIRAGRMVPLPPVARPRGPGESGFVMVDRRFEGAIPHARPLPSRGPFASALVPEDLNDLRQRELDAIGRVIVPDTIKTLHPGLSRLTQQELRRRHKYQSTGQQWHRPVFDDAVSQRILRLYNSILRVLSKRGHDGFVYDGSQQLQAAVTIGDSNLNLGFSVFATEPSPPGPGSLLPGFRIPAAAPLTLSVSAGADRHVCASWSDDDDGKLEGKIALIVASLVVESEAMFRNDLRIAEENAKRVLQATGEE